MDDHELLALIAERERLVGELAAIERGDVLATPVRKTRLKSEIARLESMIVQDHDDDDEDDYAQGS